MYRVLEAIVFSLCHVNLYVLLLLLQWLGRGGKQRKCLSLSPHLHPPASPIFHFLALPRNREVNCAKLSNFDSLSSQNLQPMSANYFSFWGDFVPTHPLPELCPCASLGTPDLLDCSSQIKISGAAPLAVRQTYLHYDYDYC